MDYTVWNWVREEIGNPEILERKLREIEAGQKNGNAGKEEQLNTLHEHKEQIEQS